MPISVFETLDHLQQERYRAVIFHAAPDQSPRLSSFCQKICTQVHGKYLDLLEHFIQTPVLSKKIDTFSPEKCRELLIEQSQAQSLLIVDHADFLLDTWRRSERKDFFRMITNQWDSYKDGMKARLVIVLQTSPEIESLNILDSQGKNRLFRLQDFYDLR